MMMHTSQSMPKLIWRCRYFVVTLAHVKILCAEYQPQRAHRPRSHWPAIDGGRPDKLSGSFLAPVGWRGFGPFRRVCFVRSSSRMVPGSGLRYQNEVVTAVLDSHKHATKVPGPKTALQPRFIKRTKPKSGATPLRHAYRLLRERLGHQNWWPAETPFEACLGAILTQNTNWVNVRRAIANLKDAQVLEPKRLFELYPAHLSPTRLVFRRRDLPRFAAALRRGAERKAAS